MQNKQQKSGTSSSQTGVHPRADLNAVAPPEAPDTLPEVADPGSTTGNIPTVSEGEDTAKNHDDSASGNRPRR